MTIHELKKELGLSNKDIAGFFGLSTLSYANSSAKKRYENALCSFYEYLNREENRPAQPKQPAFTPETKDQKSSQTTEPAIAVDALLCPIDLFRYFIRKLYNGIEISNDDIDKINIEFSKYLTGLNMTDIQKENILPKSTFDVILNSEHPFRVEGFPPAFIFHFDQFIEKEKAKAISEGYSPDNVA